MDFLTGTVLSGLLWDFIRYRAEPTIQNIREAISKVVNIDETVAIALKKELMEINAHKSETQAELTAKLASSDVIKEILTQISSESSRVTINHYGSGDAFGGDKIMGNKIVK